MDFLNIVELSKAILFRNQRIFWTWFSVTLPYLEYTKENGYRTTFPISGV
uniref:Uncharacterized protein n=1 Tax=Octopus bimaculoides TaxID=37653 RepID=A0A0L8I260_OCTBM